MKMTYRILINLAVVLALIGLAGALVSGGGARLGWWGFGTGFTILKWSAYAAAAAVVSGLAAAALAKPAGAKWFDIRLVLVLPVGVLVFAVPYCHSQQFRQTPTIADATTNIDDPPSFQALVPVRRRTADNPLEYRGEKAASLQRAHFPSLSSLYTDQPPADAIEHAETVIREMGLEIAAALPGQGRLEATDTTFWFGFKDDVVVRARAQSDGRTRVDVRSASRVGYLDGGVNAKRIQRFLQGLEKRLGAG